MSAWTFEFWPPDLDSECSGEYLRKFLLGSKGSGSILVFIVKDVSSLGAVSKPIYEDSEAKLETRTFTPMR